MSAVASLLTVGWWLASLAVGYWLVSTHRVRAWAATPRGEWWTRGVGVLAALVAAGSAGAFSVNPPLGVYLLVVAGVLAFAAGALAAAAAADVALRATAEDASLGRVLRAFWYAAGMYYRVTRYGLLLALASFLLGAIVAGVSVDPTVTAAGALALGGGLAALVGLAAVGVFVPAGRNEAAAEAVERTV